MDAVDERVGAGRDSIVGWFREAVAAVDPAAAVRRRLGRAGRSLVVGERLVPVDGCVVVVAIGKGALAMARGASDVAGDLIRGGVVITKDGLGDDDPPPRVRVFEAAHPVPDERGVRATREALALVHGLGIGDVVLALVSGGGSALFEAPTPPVTLAEMAETTDLLLRAGAPIDALNGVRTPLSAVKGGGFRRRIGEATVVTLILSDVLGNDPRVIASGPTIPTDGSGAEGLAVLTRYGLVDRVAPAVVSALRDFAPLLASATPGRDVVDIVGDNRSAMEAVASSARAEGVVVERIWADRTGEAAAMGRAWIDACRAAPPTAELLLGGGEATVTVRGDGIGGRNTEFALAAALALAEAGDDRWMVASLATDGDDGPTGAAGAIADAWTAERARATGLDPVAVLERNDSLRVFEAAGGLVRTGPTGTNVNDLYLALRLRSRLAAGTHHEGMVGRLL